MHAYFTGSYSRAFRWVTAALVSSISFFVICLIWLRVETLAIVISFAAIVVSLIVWWLIKQLTIPSDAQFDAWLAKKADEELTLALEEIDQDDMPPEEREQLLIVHGYAVPGMKDEKQYLKEDIFWKNGKDGVKRYSINRYTCIVPIKHQLAALSYHINAVNHSDRSQSVGEFFYSGVVSIQTVDEREYLTIGEVEYLYRTRSFLLGTSDGKGVNVTIRSLPLACKAELPGFDFTNPAIEQTIRRMRRLLRSIKEQGA